VGCLTSLTPVPLAGASGIEPAIGRLLGIVYESVTQGTWQRMKVCRNDACRWAFYDSSRNHSGTWCTMAICGNRMKGRAFRRRQPAGAAAS
jgi:predicted RNA-binding Zn ribbon-like protein